MLLPLVAQDIVERLAEEEEISQSRVVSDLVVEALKARGEMLTPHQKHAEKTAERLGLDVQTIATKPEPEPSPQRDVSGSVEPHLVTPQEQPSVSIDDEDLKLLKKLKLLKELGLL